jgi:hypothetical protein
MTTLNEIRSHSPCPEGWTKLLEHLGKTKADDEPLSLLTVLQSNGLDDALWCLCTEPTPERTRRFALACARRVEHLHPAAKTCNDVTERYLAGTATRVEMVEAADSTADIAAAHAAHAARAAAHAAAHAARAAARAAVASAADAAAYAARAAARAAEREAQTQLFMEIFA